MHGAGQNAQPGHAAVFVAKIIQRLQPQADTQHRALTESSCHRITQRFILPQLRHPGTDRPLSWQKLNAPHCELTPGHRLRLR